MKNLRLNRLQILSQAERKAREFEFHPNRNLILGRNHVGKSTLTKQIFEALGAYPLGDLPKWDKAAIVLLTIAIDDVEFQILRQLTYRAMFDMEGNLLFSSKREGEWFQLLAKFIEFNLLLTDKSGKKTLADPACIFLPFYINQDGGWSSSWHAFAGLARFQDATRSVIEYFTQIFPPQYYVAKANADEENRGLKEVDAEARILNRTRDRLSQSLQIVAPQMSANAFEAEIRELTRQLTILNAKQEFHRLEALSIEEAMGTAKNQIALTTDSLKRYGEDFTFLSSPREADLMCPTCGAHHEESFLKVLSFAEDARVLADMLIGLQETKKHLVTRSDVCRAERASLASEYASLREVLERKRGEVKLFDIIESAGSNAALRAFDQEEKDLDAKRSEHLTKAHSFEKEMKDLRSAKRKKEIRTYFQDQYAISRNRLNLLAEDVKTMQVIKRPSISGSGGPRDVLAYHSALWWTSRAEQFGSPFSIPIIVDCPAQSGQDAVNLPAILKFLSVGLPPGCQVLVTHEEDVTDEFDKRIVLDDPYSILYASEYEGISAVVLPKIESMQKALLETGN